MPQHINVMSLYHHAYKQLEKDKPNSPIITEDSNLDLHTNRQRVASAFIRYYLPEIIPHSVFIHLSDMLKRKIEVIPQILPPRDSPNTILEQCYKFKNNAYMPYIKSIDAYLLLDSMFEKNTKNLDPNHYLGDRAIIELDD